MIMDFAVAREPSPLLAGAPRLWIERRGSGLGDAAQHGGTHGAGGGGAGNHQADFLGPAQREKPQCADRVIYFIDHLQHPFHGGSV
jgi:hypothetical protein